MELGDQIETDFDAEAEWTLGQLVGTVSRSRRNIHPVVNGDSRLLGIVPLEEIRSVMFDQCGMKA